LVALGAQSVASGKAGRAASAKVSSAAAEIAGATALLRSKYPDASLAKVQEVLQDTGRKVTDPGTHLEFVQPDVDLAIAALGGDMKSGEGVPQTACETVCVEIGPATRRVILAFAQSRQPIDENILAALKQVFGPGAKLSDLGDGKVLVLLPDGLLQEHVDAALRRFPNDIRILPDRRMQPLQPSGVKDL
jgi:hypothetical protein